MEQPKSHYPRSAYLAVRGIDSRQHVSAFLARSQEQSSDSIHRHSVRHLQSHTSMARQGCTSCHYCACHNISHEKDCCRWLVGVLSLATVKQIYPLWNYCEILPDEFKLEILTLIGCHCRACTRHSGVINFPPRLLRDIPSFSSTARGSFLGRSQRSR